MNWCEIYEFLKEWQTLLGALIALAAAIWTIIVMRSHAVRDDVRHKNLMHRREMAARAQMPDALSEVSAYSKSVGRYLTNQTEEVPSEPTAAITTLKHVIEHIDDKAAQRVFDLVSWYQVQRARTVGRTPIQIEPQRSEGFYDIVLLQAYTNSLFEYARNQEPTAPVEDPTKEEMIEASKNTFGLVNFAQQSEMFEVLNATIDRRHDSTTSIG
jgi:hypothetical protein